MLVHKPKLLQFSKVVPNLARKPRGFRVSAYSSKDCADPNLCSAPALVRHCSLPPHSDDQERKGPRLWAHRRSQWKLATKGHLFLGILINAFWNRSYRNSRPSENPVITDGEFEQHQRSRAEQFRLPRASKRRPCGSALNPCPSWWHLPQPTHSNLRDTELAHYRPCPIPLRPINCCVSNRIRSE